jgi:hypothetical protein
LITDHGRRVLLRVLGRHYELGQDELRMLLGVPPGPPGLGITIEGNRFSFEFAADNRTIVWTAERLRRALARQLSSKS